MHRKAKPRRPHNKGPRATLQGSKKERNTFYRLHMAVSRTLNPLYRVLFNIPSQYFFTIDLTIVCTFCWSIPAIQNAKPSNYNHRKRTWYISRRASEAFTLHRQIFHLIGPIAICNIDRIPSPTLPEGFGLEEDPVSFAITKGIAVAFF